MEATNTETPVQESTASPRATMEELTERVNLLEKKIEEQSQENRLVMANFTRMMANAFSQQSTHLYDSVFPPSFEFKMVDGEVETKNNNTVTILVEEDGSYVLLRRDEKGTLLPVPDETSRQYPVEEFLSDNSVTPGSTVHANIYRVQGGQ